MDYSTFNLRFSGAFRTKHVNFPLDLAWKKTSANKRVYHLSRRTEVLPPEFIRLDPWEGEYLFLVAARARVGIVETGRFNGGSVFLMACANSRIPIHSIDISPQDDARLISAFADAGVGENVTLIVGDSHHQRYGTIGAFDVLFIDGDHSYEGCTADLATWYPLMLPGGQVVLHDCYHGSPVMDAVIDFLSARQVLVHRSPYNIGEHWNTSFGSLAHFSKPLD